MLPLWSPVGNQLSSEGFFFFVVATGHAGGEFGVKLGAKELPQGIGICYLRDLAMTQNTHDGFHRKIHPLRTPGTGRLSLRDTIKGVSPFEMQWKVFLLLRPRKAG